MCRVSLPATRDQARTSACGSARPAPPAAGRARIGPRRPPRRAAPPTHSSSAAAAAQTCTPAQPKPAHHAKLASVPARPCSVHGPNPCLHAKEMWGSVDLSHPFTLTSAGPTSQRVLSAAGTGAAASAAPASDCPAQKKPRSGTTGTSAASGAVAACHLRLGRPVRRFSTCRRDAHLLMSDEQVGSALPKRCPAAA